MKKKIVVVDDEPLIASLMKEIIEEDTDLEIAFIATDKNEFLNAAGRQSFDAALIDISVGGNREGGIELLQMMKARAVDLPLIMLSAHDETHYALKCLQAGARGYINKRYICTDVVKCVKAVIDGHLFVTGEKGGFILKQYKESSVPVSIESV